MFLKTCLLTVIVYLHSWLSILLMLTYMGTVIVILLNILIAQMSTTYAQARVARLEYDVDRILLLTRMERFPLLVSHIWEGWSEWGLWIIGALARDESLENMKFQSCYEHETEKIPVPGGIRTLVECNLVPGIPRTFKRRDPGNEVGSDAIGRLVPTMY